MTATTLRRCPSPAKPYRYPGGDEPAENAFDLKRPETHTPAESPPLPPEIVLPPPRRAP